jgi:cell division protein FtsL
MMTEQHEAKSPMIRYLLGQMSDHERSSFEEQYQKDTGLFYELAELENDLIDLYALGALSEGEQEQMRSFLADPDRQKRLAFAKTLAGYPGPESESVRPNVEETNRLSWRVSKHFAIGAIATAAAVMIVAVSWLFVANRNLSRELESLRNQQSAAQKKEQVLEQQIDTLKRELEQRGKSAHEDEQSPLLAQNTVSFSLRSDVVRGDGPAPTLAIPSSAQFVVLDVTVPGHATSRYDLFLETADGNPVLRQEHVRGKPVDSLNTQLAIKLRSHILQDGDYVLRVATAIDQKTEDVAGYSFRVIHR